MRAFAFCLGFNTAEMIEGSLQNFEDTTTDQENRFAIKTLVNPWFPGTKREDLCRIATKFGWWGPVDIPNKGVMENWNYCIHELAHMRKGDYLITHDPDVRWQQKGWLSAAIEILEAHDDVVFVCASRPFHDHETTWKPHGRKIHSLASGTRYATYKQLIAWSTGVWKGEWLAQRPRDFKAAHPFYAWCEHRDIEHMNQHKKRWLSLVDYYDNHLGSDAVYSAWKLACAKGETDLEYGAWLAKQR